MAYATLTQYQLAYPDADLVTDQQLNRASLTIDDVLRGGYYDPADATVIAALRDATCAQAYATRPQGDTLAPGQVKAATLGNARYELQDSTASIPEVDGRGVSIEARQILIRAGLLPLRYLVVG